MVVVSLVRTLTESFGSANDLYRRLKRKNRPKDGDDGDEPTFHILPHNPLKRPLEKRHNLEKHIRWGSDVKRGDDSDKEEELISTSSNQVRVEYDRGYRKLGEPFARGDRTYIIFSRTYWNVTYRHLLILRSNHAYTIAASDYSAPADTDQHSRGSASQHLPSTLVFPLSSRQPNPDYSCYTYWLHPRAYFAVRADAPSCLPRETNTHSRSIPTAIDRNPRFVRKATQARTRYQERT